MKTLLVFFALIFAFNTQAEDLPPCCAEEAETSEALPEDSLYWGDLRLVDQSQEAFDLKDLAGKPVAISMFFTSCAYACPRLASDMRRLEDEALKAGMKDFRLVLISMDPENDSSEALKKFALRNRLLSSRWTLATPENASSARLMGALLNLPFKKQIDGSYGHANKITLLDAKGTPVFSLNGLGADVLPMVEKLKDLEGDHL